MKNAIEITLTVVGLIVIVTSIAHGDGLGVVFGLALIVSPFLAGATLIYYVLVVGIPIGLALLGAFVAVIVSDKNSALIWLGLVVGWIAGFRVVVSEKFSKAIDSLGKASGKKMGE